MADSNSHFEIRYEFIFPDQSRDTHLLRFDRETFEYLDRETDGPEWTRLEREQCPNCPLSTEDTTHCPAALTISPFMERWSKLFSFEEVQVEVSTSERTIIKKTSVQHAFGSLLGLLLSTSGCPRLSFLRPMGRFHLPFADEAETVYRATSMHLLSLYFRQEDGEELEFGFDELVEQYRELQIVNSHLAARVRSTSEKDGVLNAVVLLDALAHALPYSISEKLAGLRSFFVGLNGESASGAGEEGVPEKGSQEAQGFQGSRGSQEAQGFQGSRRSQESQGESQKASPDKSLQKSEAQIDVQMKALKGQ